MTGEQWFKLLVGRGCLYRWCDTDTPYHFVGNSGAHLGGYGNLDPILCDQWVVEQAAAQWAAATAQGGEFYLPGGLPEAVVVPAVGEIALLHPTTTALRRALDVPYIGGAWGDKVNAAGPTKLKIVRPGFAEQVRGKRVLVVIDLVNRMHSANLLISEVQRLGGRVVGVCAIAYNVNNVSAEALGVPFFYGLCPFGYPTWSAEECQQRGPCANGVPIVTDTTLGHGAEFRAAHPELPDERFVLLGV